MTVTPVQLPTRQVGPVPFRVAPLPAAVDSILSSCNSPTPIHFANAYTIALADSDPAYARLLSSPTAAVFSDGVPVTWVGKRGYPEIAGEWERVYGPDVMTAVFDRCDREHLSVTHYLVGGTPDTLARLLAVIRSRWPGARIAGSESPPFRPPSPHDLAQRDARIRGSGAALVWIGLGTPKQDWEAARLAQAVGIPCLAVGAAFDFIAGAKVQAPLWMQRSGTEWAFRLAREPRRLGRRYLWGNPRFLWAVRGTPGWRRRH